MIWISLSNGGVTINGEPLRKEGTRLTELYRQYINDYPKFFKMDGLCRLGFVASELLLGREQGDRFVERDDRGVVLFGSVGSADADRRYQATISDWDNYYPSPSVFVYTLPNIVTGEIAIRNKYHGETAFYLMDAFSSEMIARTVACVFDDAVTKSVVGGWLDYVDEEHFHAAMFVVGKEEAKDMEEMKKQMEQIYKLK